MQAEIRRVHRFHRIHRILDYAINCWPSWFGGLLRVISPMSLWLIAAFVALIRFTDPTDQDGLPKWLLDYLTFIHHRRFVIVVGLIAVQAACQGLLWIGKRLRRPDSMKIGSVLDMLVSQVFPEQDRRNHVYRATLFKVRSCWFCGSWLGIVSRSGKMYPQKTTVFCVSGKTRANCTGIAGECWRQDGLTYIGSLPECRSDPVPDELLNEYKLAGCLDDRELAIMNVKSTVFLATGIRVAGRLWGIVVADSTDLSTLPKQLKRHEGALDFAAVSIEQLVT